MRTSVKVLIIDDDEDDAFLTKGYLSEMENYSFDVSWERDSKVARQRIIEGDFDLFLVDYRLGTETGLDLIRFIQSKGVFTPCILLTGQGDLTIDIDASNVGAADYLTKGDLTVSLLERSIRYALAHTKIIRELDEKEKKYRTLFERSIDSIFLASEKLTLMDVNNSFLKLFGYTQEECFKLTIDKLFASEEAYTHFHTTLRATEQVRDFEVALLTKQGEEKICLINCVFIPDQASDFCCYQGIIHDLTVRKQSETDMLNAERLSVTGKMARTIAHEVRNPLTNVNLALDQLSDELVADKAIAEFYCDIIQRNVNRIEQLLGEMLNSSKPKELNLALNSLEEITNESIALAEDRIKLNRIQLEKNYHYTSDMILVDKDKMKVAILNVIINAVEAMKPGEGILQIEIVNSDDKLVLGISDNGIGIPLSDIEKLYDPFFTVKENGMGLGLTATKSILTTHFAEMHVKSVVGKGTTFYLQFKVAD